MGRSSDAWIEMMEDEQAQVCCGEGCDCPFCYEAGEEERMHREAWFCGSEDDDMVFDCEFDTDDIGTWPKEPFIDTAPTCTCSPGYCCGGCLIF